MLNDTPPVPPAIRRHDRGRAPLSYSQESLWFLQQLDPENNAYNSIFRFKFSGGVDRACMEQALNVVVRRHAPLRSLYPLEEGKPLQVVHAYEPVSLNGVDLSGLEDAEKSRVFHETVVRYGDQPYDLQNGPLLRCALLHVSEGEDVLLFGSHHVNLDAWSKQVFISELMQAYDAIHAGREPVLPDLPVEYTDYALWQREWLRGENLVAYTDHWKAILSGDLPVLDIPTDRPRPAVQTYHGSRYHFPLSPTLIGQLRGFCQKERITLFQLFMAAYAVMLMRLSGQKDMIMGCPFANRSEPELENLVGLFVNTLPIRVNLAGNPGVRELLAQVREVMLDAFTWQAAPFEALVSEITPERDLSRTPVFQVTINMRNVPPKYQVTVPGLEFENLVWADTPAPFDLSLEFDNTACGLLGSLQYNADLFDERTIIHMAAYFQNLLGEFLAKADRTVADLEMLTASERQRLTIDWNETDLDFPRVWVHDLFSEQARAHPEAAAVVCNGTALTYGELERRSNRLAHYLRSIGVGAGSRVGIFLPRSENLVTALLAVLKAGGAYIPLDLTYPAERLTFVIEDSTPDAVITLERLRGQLPGACHKVCLDSEGPAIDACSDLDPEPAATPDLPVYIIYTSGSTGRPKGAVNLHRGLVNYLTHANRQFHFTPADSVIQLTSLSFDVSAYEIFGPLTYGGTIYMMDDDQMRDPDYINQTVARYRVTYLSMVPTMLRALCASALAGGLSIDSLRLITPAGEALLRSDVELARRAYGGAVQVVNQYGPTETSIIAANYVVPADLPAEMQNIPIGKPISNGRTYVLDEFLHPVPAGVKGELFLGGVGVGQGYWNNPELTAARFLPDPFRPGERIYRTGDVVRQLPDGTICYLGRADNQVKIRGYRVELGEIETAIAAFPAVKETVVHYWQRPDENTLAAYITLKEGDAEKVKEDLRQHLAGRLPFYMLPAVIMVLTEIPLLPNGKVDRRALPLPGRVETASESIAPRNDIERRMAAIWESVLGVEHIGVRDNFFELGGHSLLAVRMFTLIQQEFGKALPLLLLFKESTVEALSKALQENPPVTFPGVEAVSTEGSGRPLYILPAGLYMGHLAYALKQSRPVYALYPDEGAGAVYRGSVQETAQIYYRRLTSFDPDGPYLLLGHSADGLFALELARLLRENGKDVAFLGMLDTHRPDMDQKERVKFHMDRLHRQDFTGRVQYVMRSVEREMTRWKNGLENRFSTKAVDPVRKGNQDRAQIVQAYQPEPYAGDLVLFITDENPAEAPHARYWREVIRGRLDVVPVRGGHLSMLEPPNVAALAEMILDRINRDGTV